MRAYFYSYKAEEEHEKSDDVQLGTAKRMLKFHCESSFTIEEGVDGEGGSSMCMFMRSVH